MALWCINPGSEFDAIGGVIYIVIYTCVLGFTPTDLDTIVTRVHTVISLVCLAFHDNICWSIETVDIGIASGQQTKWFKHARLASAAPNVLLVPFTPAHFFLFDIVGRVVSVINSFVGCWLCLHILAGDGCGVLVDDALCAPYAQNNLTNEEAKRTHRCQCWKKKHNKIKG